ncbi:hypothetical protein LSM04_009738 [Trypanosoma melophagium]|uniref:uncharacterized protein n=1 Tax=Trypanosoma melophagium TaxID=715481 RepID=UPI00351A76B0|nr:hypothetical protein LSM04_009738 [Trypanosoma melophagium]
MIAVGVGNISTLVLPMKNTLQFIDAHTVVYYCASCESQQSDCVDLLLTALRYNTRREKTTQTKVKEMRRQSQYECPHTQLQSHDDNNSNINNNMSIGLHAVFELLQDCSLTSNNKCRESEEQQFISTLTAIQSLNSTTPKRTETTITTRRRI